MAITEDLARIALQEQHLQFTVFNEEIAWKIGSQLRALAVARSQKIVIDVRRIGHPLFYSALAGTTPDNIDWVRRKINVVERFHKSSYAVGLEMEQKKSSLTESQGLPLIDYAVHGGCFPIRGVSLGIIGSITVSGLPQRADHELVIEVLCAELGFDLSTLRLE